MARAPAAAGARLLVFCPLPFARGPWTTARVTFSHNGGGGGGWARRGKDNLLLALVR